MGSPIQLNQYRVSVDAVFEAIQLEVIAGDVYVSGKLQPVSGGNVVVRHQWEKSFETQLPYEMK